jgi:hypothetical protein
MAQTSTAEGIFESFTRMSEAFLNFDLRKAAASYIDLVENLANQALDFYEMSKGWTKETPLEPFVDFQTSLSRKLVETSISAVRNLWQLEPQTS